MSTNRTCWKSTAGFWNTMRRFTSRTRKIQFRIRTLHLCRLLLQFLERLEFFGESGELTATAGQPFGQLLGPADLGENPVAGRIPVGLVQPVAAQRLAGLRGREVARERCFRVGDRGPPLRRPPGAAARGALLRA